MKVIIEYTDNTSLTVEEIVKQAEINYGKFIKIDISPESTMAYDHIYFGLQQLITYRQLNLLYDKTVDYPSAVKSLKQEVLDKTTEILDQVIIDNESKIE